MPKSIKNIVVAKFGREKDTFNQTFVFDEIGKHIQDDILSKTALTTEQCLIIRFVDNENWFLLCLDKIVINQQNEYEEIIYNIITKVEPYFDLEKLNKVGPFKIDKIRIVCENYQKVVNVEPGSWGAIISIFIYFITLNKNNNR